MSLRASNYRNLYLTMFKRHIVSESDYRNKYIKNPSKDPSKHFEKKMFGYLFKKIWFRVCSVTAKVFELRNSGENRRKRSEIFFRKFTNGI